MVVVLSSQFLLQIVSTMMIGHLGDELYLSSTALAISLAGVTGFSFLMGMASGLETICGQAFGAKQYNKIGTHTLLYSLLYWFLLSCLFFGSTWKRYWFS
ncbi:hypothetical protein RIF29_29004 [Crotalaria pallida]|uniref:MATE efflux family protein n=1 Tax=Crotalaria pallida TaxID=3830 RepID=A0AAN9EE01_CROPI